jgi:nitroimidazol reductase NimA-like FMN-containing flavoprotein (pyridoxamine 5'-phosphate oxidase superfamily)
VTGQRRLTELSREQSLELLGSVSLGRLVFTYRAMPAIRPVNHLLDGGDVIIRSHTGAAVVPAAGAAWGVVVAYEADAIDPGSHLGWSVVITGTARLVRDTDEVARYQQLLSPWAVGEIDQVIRIRAEIVTGFSLDGDTGTSGAPGP